MKVLEARPQPSRWCMEESGHGVVAAALGRQVGPVMVGRYGNPTCYFEPAGDDVDPATAIRADLVITVAGNLAKIFYKPELDEKLYRLFGCAPHAEELLTVEPAEWELELRDQQPEDDPFNLEIQLPNDDAQAADLLDRLELLEPDIDRKREYQEAEGRAAGLLHRHQDIVYAVAELLRDQRLIQPGVVNAIFSDLAEQEQETDE